MIFDHFIGHEKLYMIIFKNSLVFLKILMHRNSKLEIKDRNKLLEKSKITVIFQDAQIFNVWKAFLNIR